MDRARDGDLRRQLGFLDVVALQVGTVLGSGIFVAPAAVAAATPSVPAAVALWLLGGLVAACGAACYAECAVRLPRAGGFYVYYRQVYGPALAFVGGWAALLVTYPASTAAIALVFGRYLGEVAPALEGRAVPCAAAALLVVAIVNILGVRLAARVQLILSGAKIAALAAVCVAAVVAAGGGAAPASAAAGAAGGAMSGAVAGAAAGGGAFFASAILGAFVVLLWTYDGWSDVGMIAGEVRDPARTLGRAVLAASAALVTVYATVQVAVMALLPPSRAAVSERVLAEAVEAGLGGGAARLVALLIVVCTFGSVHSVILAASRLGYAMARDGAFFGWFGRVEPRFGTPARSIAALVATTLFYVFAAGFRDLLGLFSFSVWIFYALTAAALLVLRRRGTGAAPGSAGGAAIWRAPGGIAAPLVVVATAACMTTGLTIDSPRRSLAGTGLLLLGFGVYLLWRRRARIHGGSSRAIVL
jgi:APA family basic amino acid/polyamine antiporter